MEPEILGHLAVVGASAGEMHRIAKDIQQRRINVSTDSNTIYWSISANGGHSHQIAEYQAAMAAHGDGDAGSTMIIVVALTMSALLIIVCFGVVRGKTKIWPTPIPEWDFDEWDFPNF